MSHQFGRPAACCTTARRRFDSTRPNELRRELPTRPQVLPRVGNASGRRCFGRRRYCQSRSLAVAAAESVGTSATAVAAGVSLVVSSGAIRGNAGGWGGGGGR